MKGWREEKGGEGQVEILWNGGSSVFGVTDNAGSRAGKNSVPEVELRRSSVQDDN